MSCFSFRIITEFSFYLDSFFFAEFPFLEVMGMDRCSMYQFLTSFSQIIELFYFCYSLVGFNDLFSLNSVLLDYFDSRIQSFVGSIRVH